MSFSQYFRPLNADIAQKKYILDNYKIGDFTKIYTKEFPDWKDADIVIVGCDEDRGSKEIKGSAMAPDIIRKQLYQLAVPKREIKLADLGNLQKREKMVNYYDDLADVVHEIVKAGKICLLLGGTQDITFGQYMGYKKVTSNVEYVSVDSELDVEDSDFGVNNHTYNHKIFVHSPNILFNYTNLGNQSYFVSLADRKRMQNLFFNAVRLGQLRNDLKEAEPYLRNAEMVSVDLACVRSADAPGVTHPSPAGFTAEEACQIVRYAGLSNRVSSISFSEVNPMKDLNSQTSMLTAMMVWYFIEGFYNRRNDEVHDTSSMTKHRITLKGGMHDLVFYFNPRTERWWMEVPYMDSIGKEDPRTELFPCSEADYLMAKEDEIPEKWWMAHYKLK